MTATLSLAPNPITPGSNVRVNGAGFDPAKKVQLALDGSGWTTNYFRPAADGSFHVGVNVSTKPKTQSLSARYAGSSAIVATVPLTVAVPPPVVIPPPVIPPPEPGPPGKVVEFIGNGAQFVTLAKDPTVGTIVTDGFYKDWTCFYDVLRTAAKPLLVKGNAIWDGAGLVNSPPFRIGWSSPAAFTTFDGTFVAQNYRIGKAGIIMAKQFDTFGFHGLTVRDCYGDRTIDSSLGQQHAHALYIGSNGPASPRSRNWSSRGLVVEGPDVPSSDPRYRMLNGVQTDGSPNADGVVITGAKISRCNRGYFLYNGPTGVLVDGGEITDCGVTIDNTPNAAQGIVRNVHALRSGPLAPGSGSWRAGSLVDGGGNTSA